MEKVSPLIVYRSMIPWFISDISRNRAWGGANKVLKSAAVNGSNLFWIITVPISLALIIGMMRSDLSNGPAVSSMIQASVRCAMTWQGFFITEVYVMRDVIEGVVGYLFLGAMTLTSFMPIRKHMAPKSWKLLHKSGMYFLWAYAFSVYWWNLFYYDNPGWLDYTCYWMGFAAWGLRAAAWTKKRRTQLAKQEAASNAPAIFGVLAYIAIGVGLVAAAFGKAWYPTAANLLTGYSVTRIPELYVPYWPFEPWLPVFVIALGAYMISRTPRTD